MVTKTEWVDYIIIYFNLPNTDQQDREPSHV